MKIAVVFLVVIATVLAKAPLLKLSDPEKHIPGQYIIVLHETTTDDYRDKHITQLSAKFQAGHKILHKYHIGDFIGFSAAISDDLVEYERNSVDVKYIEHDGVVSTHQSCLEQQGSIWNLDRVALRNITALDGHYHYPSQAGLGVVAYVIDTGIYTQHNDFGGRAVWGWNTVDSNNNDCNGHGTHVASTIGGTVYGVAKSVSLVAVKVLNCAGSGSNAGVIAGVDWVTANYNARPPGTRAVANMSLGGARSTATNTAVSNSINAGIQYAIAAGNSNTDACNSSPASVPNGVTVASTALIQTIPGAQADQRSSFSNYGPCVLLFAPGSTIRAAWINSPTATNTISGTSMASPHVCGVLALLAGASPSPLSSAALRQQVNSTATANVIDRACSNSVCNQTPNRMIFNGCNQ